MKHSLGSRVFILSWLLASSLTHAESFSLESFWGRNTRFWNNVDSLKSSASLVDDMERIFESNYRDPSEGILQLSAGYTSVPPDLLDRTFDRGLIKINYDQIAGGEIYDRVSPQLRGYSVWTTSFNAALISEPREDSSGVEFLLGNEVGYGRQRLIDAAASDFLFDDPEAKSSLFYYGIDLSLAWKNQVTPHLRFRNKVSFHPTYFYSAFKNPAYEFRVNSEKIYYRWRSESEFAALWSGWAGGEVGVHALGGQQPIPVNLIPRVWDAVHRIEAFPSFGSVVGLGTFFRLHSRNRNLQLQVQGGFYGGYLGASANLRLYFLELEAGSFGLEQTPGFQVRESRVNYVSGGIRHVW